MASYVCNSTKWWINVFKKQKEEEIEIIKKWKEKKEKRRKKKKKKSQLSTDEGRNRGYICVNSGPHLQPPKFWHDKQKPVTPTHNTPKSQTGDQ